jgi:hypothetical protein
VAEHHQQRDLELVGAVLEAAHHRVVHDLAGGADHEQVAEPTVEDQLGRDAGVHAAEDHGEGVLPGDDGLAARLGLVDRLGLVVREALVALDQALQRLLRALHRELGRLGLRRERQRAAGQCGRGGEQPGCAERAAQERAAIKRHRAGRAVSSHLRDRSARRAGT